MTQEFKDNSPDAVNIDPPSWGSYVTGSAPSGAMNPAGVTLPNAAPAPAPAPAPMAPPQGALPAAAPVQAPPASPAPPNPMQQYMQALNQYQAVLDSQAKQSSQIPWFQIAGALGNPGRTGSFGEAMSNAAGVMGKYQDEQQKNQIPLAKARLDLIKSKYELGKQSQAQEDFTKLIGGQPSRTAGTTAGTAAVVGQELPHPADPNAPSSVTLVGANVHPNDTKTPRSLTMQDALNYAASHPEDKERISLLTEAAKQGLPNYLIAQNGVVFNQKTGKYITDQSIPGQEQKTYTTPFGRFSMTAQEYENFNKAPEAAQVQMLTKMFGTNERGAPKTLEDHDVEAAARKETGTKQASADVGGAQTLLSNRRAGEAMLPVYERIQTILDKPGVKSQLGLFKKGDVADVVSAFLQGDHSEKSIAAMQDAIRRAGGNDDLINAINDIDGQRGIAEAEYMRSMPGNARMTDFRLKFVKNLHPDSQNDMYGAFQDKLNEFKNRANWDIDQHDLFTKLQNEKGITYTQFSTQVPAKDAFNGHRKAYAAGQPTNEPVPAGTTQEAPSGSIIQRLEAEKARRDKLKQTPQ